MRPLMGVMTPSPAAQVGLTGSPPPAVNLSQVLLEAQQHHCSACLFATDFAPWDFLPMCNIVMHFKQLTGWSALPRAQEGLAAGEDSVRGWEIQEGNFSRKRPEAPSLASEWERPPRGWVPGKQVYPYLPGTQRKFQESWLSSNLSLPQFP